MSPRIRSGERRGTENARKQTPQRGKAPQSSGLAQSRDTPLDSRGKSLQFANEGSDINPAERPMIRTARKAADRRRWQIVLLYKNVAREVADSCVVLSEADAGEWVENFNRIMRATPWRAAIVQRGSLAGLPTTVDLVA